MTGGSRKSRIKLALSVHCYAHLSERFLEITSLFFSEFYLVVLGTCMKLCMAEPHFWTNFFFSIVSKMSQKLSQNKVL